MEIFLLSSQRGFIKPGWLGERDERQNRQTGPEVSTCENDGFQEDDLSETVFCV